MTISNVYYNSSLTMKGNKMNAYKILVVVVEWAELAASNKKFNDEYRAALLKLVNAAREVMKFN